MGELGDRISNNNVFNWVFGFDIEKVSIHLGPIEHASRGVWFFYVTTTLLVLAGLAVLITRNAEVRTKWTTWAIIAPVVGIPLWFGQITTLPLVFLIGSIAVWEFARLFKLPRPERLILHGLAILYPLAAYVKPDLLQLVPLITLLCALPSIFTGDVENGMRRATITAFGSVWICWALSFFIIIWKDAFLVCFAVAGADVAAWCGGKLLRRFGWARKSLSPLSPNKTVGGLVGGIVGGALMLTLLGSISLGLVIAVGLGAVCGDLLESMVKREVGVKDAGNWLPGFGGILDRIDSILLVLPLAAVLGVYL